MAGNYNLVIEKFIIENNNVKNLIKRGAFNHNSPQQLYQVTLIMRFYISFSMREIDIDFFLNSGWRPIFCTIHHATPAGFLALPLALPVTYLVIDYINVVYCVNLVIGQ